MLAIGLLIGVALVAITVSVGIIRGSIDRRRREQSYEVPRATYRKLADAEDIDDVIEKALDEPHGTD